MSKRRSTSIKTIKEKVEHYCLNDGEGFIGVLGLDQVGISSKDRAEIGQVVVP